MKSNKLFKLIRYIASIITLSVILSSNAYAAWFKVTIVQVVPRAETPGDVFIQVKPGKGETSFNETARGIIQGGDAGANKIMAAMLTAISLNTEVTVLMDNPPSWASPQIVQGVGLVAP